MLAARRSNDNKRNDNLGNNEIDQWRWCRLATLQHVPRWPQTTDLIRTRVWLAHLHLGQQVSYADSFPYALQHGRFALLHAMFPQYPFGLPRTTCCRALG